MPKISFVETDGSVHEIDAEAGYSLMETARNHGVPGIDGDCGGVAMCGTCHVLIAENDFFKLGEISSDEEQMLVPTPGRTATSRLACQVQINDDLDGLVVRLPEYQM